jgi:hypothetical protein
VKAPRQHEAWHDTRKPRLKPQASQYQRDVQLYQEVRSRFSCPAAAAPPNFIGGSASRPTVTNQSLGSESRRRASVARLQAPCLPSPNSPMWNRPRPRVDEALAGLFGGSSVPVAVQSSVASDLRDGQWRSSRPAGSAPPWAWRRVMDRRQSEQPGTGAAGDVFLVFLSVLPLGEKSRRRKERGQNVPEPAGAGAGARRYGPLSP